MSGPTLRPYQTAMLDAIATSRAGGHNRLLCQAATGLGKTVVLAAMLRHPPLRDWLGTVKAKGAEMLVIAHRSELLDQALEKIQRANPGAMCSIEQGDRHANRFSDVVIASIQTLQAMSFRRLKSLLRHHQFRLVVIDEAHHAAAASYRTALVHLGFLPPSDASDSTETEAADFEDVEVMQAALTGWDAVAPQDRLLVGVTATPNRSDAIGLGCVFQEICFSYGTRQGIDAGFLTPVVPWVVETDTSLDAVRITAGEFNQKDLGQAVNTDRRNDLALAAWREHADGLQTIGFTVDVAHAHALCRTFEVGGVRARAVSGETPKDDRREILRSFREGRCVVLTNCMVLTEGTDLPMVQCILHAKPTKSATLYAQMTGRGLRPYEGKAHCVVIDLVDVARKHSLMAAPVLYGLPPGIKTEGADLKKTAEDLEALLEAHAGFDIEAALRSGHLTLAQLQARATTFDVFSIPELGGEVSSVVSMNWISTGNESYRLQYPWEAGTETLVVQKDMLGHFELAATFRQHLAGGPVAVRQRTLASGLGSSIEALRAAEAFVQAERRMVTRLKDRDAPWRSRPASAKQLQMLDRLRVPYNRKALTMGGASDAIDMAMARKGR